MNNIKTIVDKWRQDTLTKLCSNCEGYCCSQNLFDLTEDQLRLIFDISGEIKPQKNADGHEIFELNKDDTYSTNYSLNEACPQLKEGSCQIYDHPLRPATCKDFPVFIDEDNKTLLLHNYPCHAVSLEYTAQLCSEALDLGYIVKNLFGLGRIINQIEVDATLRRAEFDARSK